MEERMSEASVQTVIQGHPRYACRVHYHAMRGQVYFDYSVLVDRRIDEEIGYEAGMLGISEAVYCVAEEEALEVATC